MRWPRRGILIRLLIYVPVISLLAWRAQGGCDSKEPAAKDDALEQKLAPHRKVITLPDGTQQEVVELTAEEAEAILGHPIPRNLDEIGEDAKGGGEAKAAVEASAGAGADAKTDAPASAGAGAGAAADAKVGGETKAAADAKVDAPTAAPASR